jgi:phospholipid/cholesterol/gamma-HCH transport system substrate-binding protein
VVLSGSSEPNRVVKVTMKVERDRLPSITEDSTAETAADTLVGDKFVQIISGTSPRRVQPGMEIRFKPSPDLTKSIDLAQFRKQLLVMDSLLTEIEGGTSPLGQFVIGDQMYRDLRVRMSDLDLALRDATRATSTVGHELYTDALYLQIRDPFVKLDQSLAKLQSGQGSAGRFLRDNQQYEQVRAQIVALRQSIGDVRTWELMRSDGMYEDWNRNVGGWIRMVDEFNVTPMLLTTAVYDNLNGMAKELQGTVKDFRGNPRKFLRLKVF